MSTVEDYSDSDEDDLPQVQTSVLLGFPDGPIINQVDLTDPRVSRVGGSPAFHNGVAPPPASSSHCKNCSQLMQLLIQMWCPLEGSAYDRACYVWGCARSRCQRKAGSVRAFRFLKYNEKYAKKLQARKEKEVTKLKAAEAAKVAQNQRTIPISNPFSMKSNESSLDWSAGDQLFGAAPTEPPVVSNEDSVKGEEDEEGDPSDTEDEEGGPNVPSITTALEATSLSSANEWADVPSYGPIYLDTASEYIAPPARTSKSTKQTGEGGDEGQWGMEGYENIRQINEVFERFLKRTGEEATQCIRYDLSGVPLAYTEDSVYKRLFPIPPPEPGSQTTLTKSAFAVRDTNNARKPTYDPSVVAACSSCSGPRTFEFQLMPNLINILHPLAKSDGNGKTKKVSEEERKKELARMLGDGGNVKGEGEEEHLSMGWGTCMVFSCVSDCCLLDGKEGKTGWYEEEVLVQWGE